MVHERGRRPTTAGSSGCRYHRPDYVRLAKRAYETWAAVEAEVGERIVTTTGGLDLWPSGPADPDGRLHGQPRGGGRPVRDPRRRRDRRRWPQWHVDDDVDRHVAGTRRAGGPFKGNAAHRRLAASDGATLRDWTPVRAIRDAGGGDFEVVTPGRHLPDLPRRHRCRRLDERGARGFDRRLPLTVTKEQVTYFAARPGGLRAGPLPGLDLDGRTVLLRLPDVRRGGTKAAQDCGGDPVDPDRRTFARDEAAFTRVEAFLTRHLPGAVGTAHLYEDLSLHADARPGLVVDRLPGEPGVVVALGAAHGFKFASVLGRILAELSVDGSTPSAADLSRFRIDRPILLEPDPPTSWMV